jgi:rod shape-determining protein MreC
VRQLTKRQRLAALVLAVLASAFMVLDAAGSGLRSAHAGVRGTLGALYRGTDAVIGPVRSFAAGLPRAGSNENKVSALRRQVAELERQLAARTADQQTTTQLARLQLAATAGSYQVLPARVTAIGPGQGFDWTVTLDAGTSSGVRVGQTVTDGFGLVGRVLHADASSCVVLLGADPGTGVGVRDLRNGEIGVATGQGTHGYRLVLLDPTAVVKPGDKLVTGPAGSTTYIAGLSLGTVRAVRTSADGTTIADVTATTSPSTLDLVGVILVGGAPVDGRTALSPGAPQAQR